MKAIVYEGVEKLVLKDVPEPEPQEDNVIIEVEGCAICGTDVKAYLYGISSIRPPVILGHELVGKIVHKGSKIEYFNEGDRVTIATTLPCGNCRMCRKHLFNLCLNKQPIGTFINGGFAKYLAVPPRGIALGNLIKLPENVEGIDGCICEPLGCVINAQKLASVGPFDTVVVIGGGPLGILHAETAKARGARKSILIQRSEKRFEMAKRFNIDNIICSSKTDTVKAVKEMTNGAGADVVINAAPTHEAVELTFELVAKSGRISLFASLPKTQPKLEIDLNKIHYEQISVFGASDSTAKDHEEAVNLIGEKKISAKKLITHKMPLSDFKKAIDLILNREALKVVLIPE